MFETKIEQYSGPLDKLLELIEEKRLEITALNLSAVTLDFLNYLKAAGGSVPPEALSDFLVVAAKLVLIKSKTLIPELELTEVEAENLHELEARLNLYRAFALRGGGKAAVIARLWHGEQIMWTRPFLPGVLDAAACYPGSTLTGAALHGALARLSSELKTSMPETRTLEATVIKLEDMVTELIERCRALTEHAFSSVSKDRPRREVIVLFLALLHLLRTKRISVRQESPFSDIMLKQI